MLQVRKGWPARRRPEGAARVRRGLGEINGRCASAGWQTVRAAALHLVELGGAERPAVDDEAFEPPGLLGERLAEHQRAAVVGRALAAHRRRSSR